MNIYSWKSHWNYKTYLPEDTTITLSTVLATNISKINLVPTIQTEQNNSGDFHRVIIDGNAYMIMSENVVDKIGATLSQYGKLYPVFQLEGSEMPFYYYLTNVIDAMNQEESVVKYIDDIEFMIEKLILDEKKFDGSLLFSIEKDSNSTLFISEEIIELISKYELVGFFSDFHSSVKDKKYKEAILKYKGRTGKFVIRGDKEDYGDWIYRIFVLEDFSKKSLEDALDGLIKETENMQEFFTYKKTSKSKKSYESVMYLIRFKHQHTLIEEKVFFEECVKFSTLHKKMLVYINNVTNMQMYEDNTWQDEMHHRGMYAIVPLLFKDKKYAKYFGELLYKWDMSSEVFQSSVIRYAFAKYGVNDEMLKLLVWRILSDGQSIQSDLNKIFMDKKLKDAFNLNSFFKQLNKVFQEDLLKNIQYGITSFILGYSISIEECEKLAKIVKSHLGEKFNINECIDECKAPYNAYVFKPMDIPTFTGDFEKEWDTSPIETLVVGTYLDDKNRIKKSF